MATLNIRIPDALANRLDRLANHTGRTKSYYVRKMVEERIEELEDFYMALQTLEEVEAGKSKLWSHEEIENESDLED